MTEYITCYKDDLHCILAELRRLDELLDKAVQNARARGNDSDPLRGLYISR